MRVHLIKLKSTHDNLRTNTVDGEAPHLPIVGEPFLMYSTSLHVGFGTRIITTTPVTMVHSESDDCLTFTTANSEYELFLLDGSEDEKT